MDFNHQLLYLLWCWDRKQDLWWWSLTRCFCPCPETVFICTQMLSVRVGSCFGDYYWHCFKCVTVTSSQTNHHNRSPSSVRHTYHCPLIVVIHRADWSANRDVKYFFLFIYVVYVDTATAWSNDSPVFFLIFSLHKWIPSSFFFFSILSHLSFSLLILLIVFFFFFDNSKLE